MEEEKQGFENGIVGDPLCIIANSQHLKKKKKKKKNSRTTHT